MLLSALAGVAEEAIVDGVVAGQRHGGGSLGQAQQVAHGVPVLVGGQPAQGRHGGADGAGRDGGLRAATPGAGAAGRGRGAPGPGSPGPPGEGPLPPPGSLPGRSPTDPLQATVSSAMGNARPRAAGVITRTSVAR